jgi:peptidoglycan/xylan/chitin deacetylase (PgdA/CDA1 family)
VRGLIAVLLVASCHPEHRADYTSYAWNDRRVLCSMGIDDIGKSSDLRPRIDHQLALAREYDWVTIFHAHTPGVTISNDMIEHVLATADQDGVGTVRFSDFAPGARPRPGVALAFDDDAVDSWLGMRDMLARHNAQVTFFVCCWDGMTDEQRNGIAMLAAAGNDIEPHGAQHRHATAFVAANGIPAYLSQEMQPSLDAIAAVRDPGPTTFAYPYGDHTPEIDEAVLQRVDHVRTNLGQCPY